MHRHCMYDCDYMYTALPLYMYMYGIIKLAHVIVRMEHTGYSSANLLIATGC